MIKKDIRIPSTNFPLTHIVRMTDRLGILEHCIFTTPDKTQGYTTDDNARALQVALRIDFSNKIRNELVQIYLKFLVSARTKDGFHNNLNPDMDWQDKGGTGEWFGRAMEALSDTALLAPDDLKTVSVFVLDQLSPLIKNVHDLRTNAHLIVALSNRIRFDTLSPELNNLLKMQKKLAEGDNKPLTPINFGQEITRLANELVEAYQSNKEESWRWYEESLTYDNARLPLGLFHAYKAVGKKIYLKIAKESLNFLIEKTYNTKRGCFSFPGNKGWFPKKGIMALFGQQPIEAGSTVEACAYAYETTNNKKYLYFAIKAFEWYGGKNISGLSLLDPESGGVKNGLEKWGVNPNEGAESILSFAIACLSLKKVKP